MIQPLQLRNTLNREGRFQQGVECMLLNGGTSTTSVIVDFLDGIRSRLVGGDVDGAMGDLVRHLHATRAELSRFEWRHVVESVYLQHPVAHLI